MSPFADEELKLYKDNDCTNIHSVLWNSRSKSYYVEQQKEKRKQRKLFVSVKDFCDGEKVSCQNG